MLIAGRPPVPENFGQTDPIPLKTPIFNPFLPRHMECRRGLAMRILYVCLSVHLSVCHMREL